MSESLLGVGMVTTSWGWCFSSETKGTSPRFEEKPPLKHITAARPGPSLASYEVSAQIFPEDCGSKGELRKGRSWVSGLFLAGHLGETRLRLAI